MKLDNVDSCFDGLFLFSLIWSVGATCDRPSAAKFDGFLRQLLTGKVTAAAERTDFDLGPGLVINYPERLLATQPPEVRHAAAVALVRVTLQHVGCVTCMCIFLEVALQHILCMQTW